MDCQTGLVSVIIVNYNGKKWLSRCLESIFFQTYSPVEVIMVDNKSSDDSVQYVKNFFPKTKIVESQINLGFAGGNNLGINAACGEYLLLINNDTWVEVSLISELVGRLESQNLDVVAPTAKCYSGQPVSIMPFENIDLCGHIASLGGGHPFFLSGVCLLFRKDLYLKTGGLDSDFFMYFEEIDWFWRLNLLGNMSYKRFSDLAVYHAGAGGSLGQIKYLSFLWRNQNCLQMLIKNYSTYSLLWVLPLYIIQNLGEILFLILLFKFKIAFSYVQGWWFNIKHIKRTLEKRQKIQAVRKVDDTVIMKKMYFGPGKMLHLACFFRHYSFRYFQKK